MQFQTAQESQRLRQASDYALFNYLTEAKSYGVEPSALLNFQRGGYVAQSKQLLFHAAARMCDRDDGPTQIGFGGARGPGKSHALFAQIALDDCQRVAGLKVLYLRKVGKNAREQFEDLRRSVLRYVEHTYNRNLGIVSFPNGSRIIIGHFKNESDVDSYLGLEYDVICIEETTTLTESKYKTLRDSNRTSKPDFRPRIYCSTNPGNIGHGWFKKRFIEPARAGTESDTRFVFATVDDNQFIDKGYVAKLEDNTGWKLKAYRYGDWDIAAGQFFTNFNYEAVVKIVSAPPAYQTVWCAMDYGFQHWTVVYLFSYYDGKIQIVDEFRARKQLPDQNAAEIIAMLRRNNVELWRLEAFVAGKDVFAQKGDTEGKTIAQQYEEHGIILTPANTDRINGAGELLKLFGDPLREKNPVQPKIEISTRCVNLINTIPNLQHDPHRPEDVLKINADDDGNGGDDEYDCFVEGTLITTIDGYKPIEKIREGDLVLTRKGFKPVAHSWNSRKNCRILTAEFSDGTVLNATPNHPFWVARKGFSRLDALRYGDIMETVWQNKLNRKLLNLTASNSDAIQIQSEPTTGTISAQAEFTLNEALNLCISKFGSRSMEKFLAAVKYTIETETRSIIQSPILNALLQKSIQQNISPNQIEWITQGGTLKTFDRLPPRGIHQSKELGGIENTEKMFLQTSPGAREFVTSAAMNILQKIRTHQDFAQTNANPDGGGRRGRMTSLKNAFDAEIVFPQINTMKLNSAQRFVQPVRLLSLAKNGKADTFALTIAECHEYYANGILVKNCARYGAMYYSEFTSSGGYETGVPYEN